MSAPRPRNALTFTVLATAGAAFAMLQSLVLPELPTFQVALHTTQGNATWIITAYLLSASVATPILGRLGDSVGKERVLVWVLVCLAAGSVICAVATSLSVMIVGRLVQGIGGAVFPLAFGIIRDEFPKEKVAGAIGAISSLLAVGGGLGVVLAGPITEQLNYHWLFWAPLPFVVFAAVAAQLWIPESDVRTPERPAVLGALVLSGWLVAPLVAVSQGPIWGWADARVLGLFAASVVLFVLWVWVESRAERPLVDMALMRQTAVWRTNLVAFLVGVVIYTLFFVLPEFVQAPRGAGYGFHSSVTQSGLFLLPTTVFNFLAGQNVGRLTKRFGSRLVTTAGTVVVTAGLLMLVLADDHPWQIYVSMSIFGTGVGLAFAAMSNLVVESVPAHQTGVAAGVNTNIRTIGGAVGGQVAGVIIIAGVPQGALPHGSGYQNTFIALTIASAVSVLAALSVPKVRAFTAQTTGLGDHDAGAGLAVARS